MKFILLGISFVMAMGVMYIIKSNGWDVWNNEEDRWKKK